MDDLNNKLLNPSGSERTRQPATSIPVGNASHQKELWQMTRAEYESIHGQLRANTTVTGRFSPHKSAVETALNRGLPVPAIVLADYPSLVE